MMRGTLLKSSDEGRLAKKMCVAPEQSFDESAGPSSLTDERA